jgi:hypothetical protein
MAVCPHCDKLLTELTINPVKGLVPVGMSFNCMLFSCPSCLKAIGAEVEGVGSQAALSDKLDRLAEKLNVGPL